MSDIREISSVFFHRDVTSYGCIDAGMSALILSQRLTTSAVLPKMDSMIWIAHMTPSWPPSYPW